jgi:hypothetical protein
MYGLSAPPEPPNEYPNNKGKKMAEWLKGNAPQ